MASSSTPERKLARVASRQHGNVTVEQLRACGFTDRQVWTRAAAGSLVRVHTGVFAVGHRPPTRPSRWHAGVLAFGPDTALGYRASGASWEIVRGAVPTEVIVPPGASGRSRDGIVVHRAPLRPADVVVRDRIPTTTLMRTVLDLAAVQDDRTFASSFEQAQVQHHLSPDLVAVEVVCRRRYRGNGRLGRLLADAVDPARVRSVFELRFLRMCERQAIPRPLVNERVGPWELDFLWPDRAVVVETDGLRFHRTATTRRKDAEKDAWLQARDFVVVRLTWADVVEAPEVTGAAVRAALGATSVHS
jgi:hypothetical protein